MRSPHPIYLSVCASAHTTLSSIDAHMHVMSRYRVEPFLISCNAALLLQRLHRMNFRLDPIFVVIEQGIFAYKALETCMELPCMARRFAGIHSCFT